jgi:Na+/H+ antiporter NhaD/arsenite permease-like protein
MESVVVKNQEKDSPLSYLLMMVIFIVSAIIALIIKIPIQSVMSDYQYNILVILIIMELFTNLIISTGIMQFLATKLALKSRGNKKIILIFFGAMMFVISAFLNNITAVMVILPVIFVLLKAIDVEKNYLCIFFATLLALSNTGGASSPIGDFPAIVIMTSGITTFLDYIFRAMPIFIMTSIALISFWSLRVRKSDDPASQELAVGLLIARHKHIKIDKALLIPLCVILALMFVAWSFVPQNFTPPEVVACLGYVVAAGVCAVQGKKVKITIDFKSVLTIAAFLFLASVISATGILERLANLLITNISDPKLLLLTIMLITSVASGLFSAGPAAAAMMPVIIKLCNTTLVSQSHWVAIAYAAAICAGSSLFLWSATAGFILSNKVEEAKFDHSWGIGSYLKFGVINYIIQMVIALSAIALIV